MKKIMLLGNHDIAIYNFRRELIERLISEQYKVYIVLPFGEKIDEIKKLGCHCINLSIDRRGTNIKEDFKLFCNYMRLLDKIKPDVVLTYTIKPNIYAGIACELKKIPYIVNITGLGTAVENKGVLQTITLMLYRMALGKVSCVFFQNSENKKFFSDRNIANRKHRLIPGSGVNLNNYKRMDYPNEDTIEFLFIARIMKEKGIEQYLQTASYIRKKYPNTVFHILGFCEEDYIDRLKDLDQKNIIKYHGLQADVKPFLEKSHCTIHPSYYPEGMSNVILESAASGRPVITTNRSGCREAVDDGKTGYIFRAKDTKALIHKVERFINLPREEKIQMGLNARGKVEKEFDRTIVVDSYLEEINKVIAKRSNK